MGSLANPRRSGAMETNVEDATKHGGKVRTGGHRIGKEGNFFEPTVITEVPNDAHAMNNEPFGPMAMINPFKTFDDAVKEANRLPFGLAAYAWTKSAKTANAIASQVETGMITINHLGLAIARGAVRRREGFGLRLGRRHRGDRGLPESEVRLAGRLVGAAWTGSGASTSACCAARGAPRSPGSMPPGRIGAGGGGRVAPRARRALRYLPARPGPDARAAEGLRAPFRPARADPVHQASRRASGDDAHRARGRRERRSRISADAGIPT